MSTISENLILRRSLPLSMKQSRKPEGARRSRAADRLCRGAVYAGLIPHRRLRVAQLHPRQKTLLHRSRSLAPSHATACLNHHDIPQLPDRRGCPGRATLRQLGRLPDAGRLRTIRSTVYTLGDRRDHPRRAGHQFQHGHGWIAQTYWRCWRRRDRFGLAREP